MHVQLASWDFAWVPALANLRLTKWLFRSSFAARITSIQSLAEAWDNLFLVRGRFRKELPWLQFPIPKLEPKLLKETTKDGKEKFKSRDPHHPTTRALELNHEILDKMLDHVSMEFLDIYRLQEKSLDSI